MANKEDDNIGSFYMGRGGRGAAKPKRLIPPSALTVVALLVFAGILWYAYPRGAEKYSNLDVPVVQADTAPVKVAPDDPGGMEVRHQDSTVFDPLVKGSVAEVEKILPAQEEPLAKEAVAETKPAPLKKKPAAAPEKKSTKAAGGGDFYVQLGAYRDISRAKSDWAMLKKKHADLLSALSMRTEKADLGAKGVYYRLQAGTVSEVRAKEICAALKAANSVGCIRVHK